MTVSKEYLAEGGEPKQPEGKFLVRGMCRMCDFRYATAFVLTRRRENVNKLKGDINHTKVTVRGKTQSQHANSFCAVFVASTCFEMANRNSKRGLLR